eukprot:1387011-Amorphochlora_amoeboformis.AAC.1
MSSLLNSWLNHDIKNIFPQGEGKLEPVGYGSGGIFKRRNITVDSDSAGTIHTSVYEKRMYISTAVEESREY